MTTRPTHRAVFAIAAAIYLLGTGVANAAEISGDAHGISIFSDAGISGAGKRAAGPRLNHERIRITGPENFSTVVEGDFIQSEDGQPLPDGVYRFELIDTQRRPRRWQEMRQMMDENPANGRAPGALPSSWREVVVESGSFRIKDGVVPPNWVGE